MSTTGVWLGRALRLNQDARDTSGVVDTSAFEPSDIDTPHSGKGDPVCQERERTKDGRIPGELSKAGLSEFWATMSLRSGPAGTRAAVDVVKGRDFSTCASVPGNLHAGPSAHPCYSTTMTGDHHHAHPQFLILLDFCSRVLLFSP